MPYICETCKETFKSKLSLKKHICIIKKEQQPTMYEKISEIESLIQKYIIDFQYSLEMLKTEHEICFEKINEVLYSVKLKTVITNETVDITNDIIDLTGNA